MTIRVIVADDHPLFLAGVASLFSTISSTDIVATAGSSDELVEVLGKQPCDVLVTDFSMPGGRQQDGLRLIAYLLRTFPDLRIIVITMHDNAGVLGSIARLKVAGLVSKSDIAEELVTAVQSVAEERSFLSRHIRQSIGIDMLSRLPDKTRLSPRETEVLRLFASGLTGNQIAAQLHRSKKTISRQKVNAFHKLGLSSDVEFFVFLREMKGCESWMEASVPMPSAPDSPVQACLPPPGGGNCREDW
ncbi:MAG: response regulator [Janthinobacterium lividum]